jgi:hypothetical protein
MYAQDTWRRESSLGILSFNYGLRLSYWSWNKEWLISPRASLGFVPAANDNFTFRLALGLYNQRPFYKELRDTITLAGNTTVQLNQNIKSQRSFQVVAGMEYKFKIARRPFKFTTEVYYKSQWKLNPYNVNNLTAEKALETLSDITRIYQHIVEIKESRDRLMQAFSLLPCCQRVYPSDANFFLAKVTDAGAIYRYLVGQGIIVRNRSNVALCTDCLRITVGDRHENEQLLKALRQLPPA